jgi:hypothetical protein
MNIITSSHNSQPVNKGFCVDVSRGRALVHGSFFARNPVFDVRFIGR